MNSVEIAECTFIDAGRVWQQAKAAADARIAKENLDAQVRTAIEERETQERQDDDATVEEYIRRTTQIESIEELESMREPLDEQIRKFLQRNDYRGANVARRELLAVQTQVIACKHRQSRWSEKGPRGVVVSPRWLSFLRSPESPSD